MKKFARIVVSILYIIWGIGAPLSAWHALLDLNAAAMLSAAAGIIMLLAGIFGLFGIKPIKRRIFGIIILVLALISVAASVGSSSLWQPVVLAVLAFLYIIG